MMMMDDLMTKMFIMMIMIIIRTSDHLPPTLTGRPAGSPDIPAQVAAIVAVTIRFFMIIVYNTYVYI